MKRLTTYLFVLCISFVQAQSFDHIVYKQEVNQAYMLAVKDAKYTESLQKLEAVKKKYGMLYGEEYLLQSYCYKMLENDSLTALSLKSCWSVPSFDMRTMWYVNQLQPGKLMEGFNEQENQLVNEGFENGAKIRPKNADSLLQVFKRISEEDRIISNEWMMDQGNKEVRSRYDAMFREHEAFLENYVLANGYPGEKQLQFMDGEVLLLLIHTAHNEEFYQRMKPVFINEVKIGNMSPWMYARWVDQHQSYYKLLSIYQTLTDHPFMNTEEERKQISKNRYEIGLLDLEFTDPKF
ncbi:hypothetical protein [Fluviicola sp.]|uniref:hypothetical protein n=1 Tax=Fluviicola sp. TaxID=1917219 RepID=UPI003D26D512